jgi:hypothetical protein
LEVARLLVRELRGRQAPEAWNQATQDGFIPAFEPLATDATTRANPCSGFFNRIASIEIVDETESATTRSDLRKN